MKKTLERNSGKWKKLAVSTETLCGVLDCGRATAVKIGSDAGARIQIGRKAAQNRNGANRNILASYSSNPEEFLQRDNKRRGRR